MYDYSHIESIVAKYGGEIIGDKYGISFIHASAIEDAGEHDIAWVSTSKSNPQEVLKSTGANTVVVPETVTASEGSATLIRCANPKLLFSAIVNALIIEKPKASIHHTAVIDPHAEIDESAHIGPFCVIGKCKIGPNTILRGHNYLYDGVQLGAHVEIHANTVLGAIGSGYARDIDDTLLPFPHIGKTIIEDHVEVGPNTYINRGALKNTVVKKGAKIGNSVCIGHNVIIGENCIILANCVIAGSAEIGKNSWVSPNVAVKNGTKHGDNVTMGLGAVVVKNIESDTTVLGNPAQDIESFKKYLRFKKDNS